MENKKIYVVSPAFYKTGGTELLHQFVYCAKKNGYNADIAYFDATKEKNINPAFLKYIDRYFDYDSIKKDDAYFVVPETFTKVLTEINPSQCIVWWESVNNYHQTFSQTFHDKGFLRTIKQMMKNIFFKERKANFSLLRQSKLHLVQSYYAYDFLKKHGIMNNIVFVKDYLNEQYLIDDASVCKFKENIIIYNPKKGKKITENIIRKFKDLNFVPLINLNNEQMMSLQKKAKVYIDFGNHPGMDRIPRETAMMHCCVITNKCGSAGYFNDVPIFDEFKFDDYHLNYEKLHKKICDCLKNYDNNDKKFDDYRNFIMNQKMEFEADTINAMKVIFGEKQCTII